MLCCVMVKAARWLVHLNIGENFRLQKRMENEVKRECSSDEDEKPKITKPKKPRKKLNRFAKKQPIVTEEKDNRTWIYFIL